MSDPVERRFERVCVALDAAAYGDDALETAASLAAELDAQLAGFFVEDLNVLRAAAFSFTREMGLASGTSRPLELDQVERTLRSQAQAVQASLARAAEGLQLRWSFTTLRGAGVVPMLAMPDEMSVIVLGPRPGFAEARSIEAGSPSAKRARAKQCVAVLYDSSEDALCAVELAARLARKRAAPLTVLLATSDGDDAKFIRQHLERTAAGAPQVVRYFSLDEASPSRAAAAAQALSAALLVVPRAACAASQALSELLAHVECPVVLVRDADLSARVPDPTQ